MADEIAKLGFDIDTAPLAAATTQADKTTAALKNVGTAADQVSAKATNLAKTQREAATAMTGAAGGATSLVNTFQQANAGTTTLHGNFTRVQAAATVMGAAFQTAQNHTTMLAGSLGVGGGGAAGASLNSALGSTLAAIPRLLATMGPLGAVLGTVAAGASAAALAYVGLQTALASVQDRFDQYVARLSNALGSQRAAVDVFNQISTTSKAAGISVGATVDSFTRLARNADALGLSNRQLLDLTETIQKLGVVSGASQGEVASGMLQLSQALASGRLNGDELRSVMENMPALARAIADGLGVSVGQLRAMGAAGELTGEKISRAILSRTQQVRREFESLPQTTERAFQRMTDQAQEFVAALGQRLNSSQQVQALLNLMSRGLESATAAVRPATTEERIAATQSQLNSMNGNAPSVLRARLSNELANLEEERRRQTQIASRAYEQERDRQTNQPVTRGLEIARDLDELGKKQREATENVQALERAIAQLEQGIANFPNEQATEYLERLRRGLAMARQEAQDALSPLEKFQRSTTEFVQQFVIGGGGGGVRLVQQMQQLIEQQTRAKGSADTNAISQSVMNDAAARSADQVRDTQRQADAQQSLNRVFGQGTDAVRRQQIEIDVLAFRWRNFGNLSNDAIERQVELFRQFRTQLSDADRLGQIQQAARAAREQLDGVVAQIQNLGAGGFAQRDAAARVSARYNQNGTGGLDYQRFRAGEILSARSATRQTSLEISDFADRTQAANENNPALLRTLRFERQLRETLLNTDPTERNSTERAQRMKFDAERTAQLAEQSASLREQIDYSRRQLQISGLSGEQLAVQTALLERQRELRQAGVDLGSQDAQQQMSLTEELAKANYRLEQRRQEAQEVRRIWTVAAEGIQDAITEAFKSAFESGTFSGKKALEIIGNLAQRIASQILSATVFTPLGNFFQQFGNDVVTPWLTGRSGSVPLSAVEQSYAQEVLGAVAVRHAGGMVDGSGPSRRVDMRMFANAPRFHTGGLVGDERPIIAKVGERVLTREQQAAMGGGTTVQVFDQRSNANGPATEVSEGQGDGGRRFIRVTVRDEVRRSIRSGDLDREMATNFGSSRVLTRR